MPTKDMVVENLRIRVSEELFRVGDCLSLDILRSTNIAQIMERNKRIDPGLITFARSVYDSVGVEIWLYETVLRLAQMIDQRKKSR